MEVAPNGPEAQLNVIPGAYTRNRFRSMQEAAAKVGNVVVKEYNSADPHELANYTDLRLEADRLRGNSDIVNNRESRRTRTPAEISEIIDQDLARGLVLVSIEHPRAISLAPFWGETFTILPVPMDS